MPTPLTEIPRETAAAVDAGAAALRRHELAARQGRRVYGVVTVITPDENWLAPFELLPREQQAEYRHVAQIVLAGARGQSLQDDLHWVLARLQARHVSTLDLFGRRKVQAAIEELTRVAREVITLRRSKTDAWDPFTTEART
ncbi:hypothetical protein ACFFKU_06990 [Kineococcus gynurae]|uniref:Uncharacterized protein n=1 Tax=Kineococcus gynurae TaxID=452979 RepID=A0ABV5LWV0_9ACTN